MWATNANSVLDCEPVSTLSGCVGNMVTVRAEDRGLGLGVEVRIAGVPGEHPDLLAGPEVTAGE